MVEMPDGVPDVAVPVRSQGDEVLPEQARGDAMDAGIVQQQTQPRIAIDEGHQAGALGMVVRLAVMAAPGSRPGVLEGRRDRRHEVAHHAEQVQVAEGVEMTALGRYQHEIRGHGAGSDAAGSNGGCGHGNSRTILPAGTDGGHGRDSWTTGGNLLGRSCTGRPNQDHRHGASRRSSEGPALQGPELTARPAEGGI